MGADDGDDGHPGRERTITINIFPREDDPIN